MFDWFWEFLYGLVKAALYCIDFIVRIAEMLCGIEPINVEGRGEVEITNYFLMHKLVIDSFKIVTLIGFALLVVFTVFSIIRSQGRLGEGKTPIKICLDSSKILLYFLLVPLIMYLASGCVSFIMSMIYRATSISSEGSIGASLFCVFADEAYDSSAPKDAIMADFMSGRKNYYSTSQVWDYFDLKDFNYFLGFVGGIAVLILLALSLLSFVERILSLMLLFVVAPISMSSAALDDGARFKLWRDQVINKFLMAYGSLITINLYIMMVNIVNGVVFFTDSSFFNGLAKLAFIIGGAFACRKAGALVGNLINHGAGTQDGIDQANLSRGVRALAARTIAPVAGAVMKPVNMALGHVKKDASAAVHRQSNAKRFVKDENARQAYKNKLEGKNDIRSVLQQKGDGQGSMANMQNQSRVQLAMAQAQASGSSGGSASGSEGKGGSGAPSTLNASASQLTRDALMNVSRKHESDSDDEGGGKK